MTDEDIRKLRLLSDTWKRLEDGLAHEEVTAILDDYVVLKSDHERSQLSRDVLFDLLDKAREDLADEREERKRLLTETWRQSAYNDPRQWEELQSKIPDADRQFFACIRLVGIDQGFLMGPGYWNEIVTMVNNFMINNPNLCQQIDYVDDIAGNVLTALSKENV